MLIQQLTRTDPERVLINVKNVEASSLTTGAGVALCGGTAGMITSTDGVSAVMYQTGLPAGFLGVAKSDIAANAYGLVIAWGYADSVLLSQETDKTIGIGANGCYLKPGPAGAGGAFASLALAENLSTLAYKYVLNLVTTNISGTLPYTKGFVRAL